MSKNFKRSLKMTTLNGCFCFPFNLQVNGPSQSGKTYFICNLIDNLDRLVDKKIDYIVWFYGQSTALHSELKDKYNKLLLVEGIPKDSFDQFLQFNKNGLFIIDDLFQALDESKLITNLVCNVSHHESVATCIVSHNMFSKGAERINLTRNLHYMVIMKNKLDMSSVNVLGAKLMPRKASVFLDIFNRATEQTFSYLLIDGHPCSPTALKFRTDIFGKTQRIFLPI